MTLTAALYSRLAVDATLTAMLSSYQGGPAIVTVDDDGVMGDVVPPFVMIAAPDVDEPFDAKVETGRDVVRPVRCYTAATGSVVAVEAIAERVRYLLHRQPVGLADGAFLAECAGPVGTPTDSSFYGREVTVRVTSLPT